MPEMGNSLRAAALLAFVVLSILVSLLISSVQQFGARISHFSNATISVDEEELASLRGALVYQLNERRKEIIPLLLPGDADENGLPEESRHSSQHGEGLDSTLDYTVWNEITLGSRKAHLDEMGCDSLVDMQAMEVLGSGYTKLVVKVNLAGGQRVALKLVNEQGIDMSKCVEDFKDPLGCRELVSYKLKKEIVLLQRLQHPNVIKVRSLKPVFNSPKLHYSGCLFTLGYIWVSSVLRSVDFRVLNYFLFRSFHDPCTTAHFFLCLTHTTLDERFHWLCCGAFPCN